MVGAKADFLEDAGGELGERPLFFPPSEFLASTTEASAEDLGTSWWEGPGPAPSKEELRGLAAKLVIFGFAGTEINQHAKRLIRLGAGGVILFARNFHSPEQVAELCSSLKREAGKRPLLIMVDQEGGRVMRLGLPFTRIPKASTIGDTRSEKAAAVVGGILGRELRAVNIDMDLAPVVDVHTNPANPVIGNRSFGTSQEVVCDMAYSFIRGLQLEGVASCAKHFPGHGDTAIDSHLELPTLTHSLDRLKSVELPPFRAAVDADVAAIMVAHVTVPALTASPDEAGRPASLSRGPIQYLRNKLLFDGLVLSDCMEMGAIVKHYTVPEAIVLGLLAGVDMFLVCHTEERQISSIERIIDAVVRGRIPYERLKEAGKRVDHIVQLYCRAPLSKEDPLERSLAESRLEVIGCREHRDVVQRILEQATSEATV